MAECTTRISSGENTFVVPIFFTFFFIVFNDKKPICGNVTRQLSVFLLPPLDPLDSGEGMLRVLLVSALAATASAEEKCKLVAPYLVYEVTPGEDYDVYLKGFNLPRTQPVKFHFTLTDTVQNGALYKVSHNYCKYGYEPSKRGSMVRGPTDVSCPSVSMLYHFPYSKSRPKGELDRFSFVAVSAKCENSCPGIVHFVDKEDPLLVASGFEAGAEGWSLTGNSDSGTAIWDRSSIGREMNRYIHGTEGWIDLDAGRTDKSLWFFKAPAKFLGASARGGFAGAYGGTFRFVLSSASGDFSTKNLNSGHDGSADSLPVVVLECADCRNEGMDERTDKGIQLIFPLGALGAYFDGTTTQISIPLSENAGWLKDSENSQKDWRAPTQNEFVQVLKRFSALRILGDYTRRYESVLLDTVRLEPRRGASGSVLPESSHEFMHFEDTCAF